MSTDQSTGRVAVITGASSGIGEATERALAATGHRIALLARRADRIQALASELGNGALAIEADVTDGSNTSRRRRQVSSGRIAVCMDPLLLRRHGEHLKGEARPAFVPA